MENITFVILGATGDLSRKKIVPAVYQLARKKKIERFAVVGAARRNIEAKELFSESKKLITHLEPEAWNRLEAAAYYQPLDFSEKEGFEKLKALLKKVEEKHSLPGNRLFYLATSPEYFEKITCFLEQTGIAREEKGTWSRVVYEKPFGQDLGSARKINDSIGSVFREDQVYRVDHYLGKEQISNIALARFTNRVLEPLWNHEHLDSVQIVLDENQGLEGRGNYYDQSGAMKDMVQSHMLQVAALLAMEAPKFLSGDYIRDEKVKVLRRMKIKDLLLGQYEGYLQEKGVAPNSTTESFVALRLEIDNKRWKGVPFFLRTGKCLDKKESSIHLKFKKVECLLPSCPSDSNYLDLHVQPKEGISLELNAKVPGKGFEVVPIKLDFGHNCLPGTYGSEAYQNILEEVIKGDVSLFLRRDEIEAAWKIIDEATENIKKQKHKVHLYPRDSTGPREMEEWNKKHQLRWRS